MKREAQTAPAMTRAYLFGGFRLDLRRRLLFAADGRTLDLTPRVLDTLVCLVRHHGSVLDRDTLMDSIWPDSDVEPNNLSQNIARIRRALGESPGTNRYIQTVPGRGYRFVADVHSESVAGGTDLEPASALAPETQQLYRQGLRLLQRPTAENCQLAVEHLRTATRLQPDFAPAWAWLADAHLLAVNVGHAGPEGLLEAERLALHALGLDPCLCVAHSVLGTVLARRGDWLAAEARLMQAVALDGTDAMPRSLHAGFILHPTGHRRRALAQLREAYALVPDEPRMLMNLAVSHCICGQDEEALHCARLAAGFGFPESVYPLPIVHLYAATRARRYAEAIAPARHLLPPGEASERAVAAVFAAMEDASLRQSALPLLLELLESPSTTRLFGGTSLLLCVQWLVALEAMDPAFDVLSRILDAAARAKAPLPGMQLLWLPELSPLRRHPRFTALARQLGFEAYWRRFGAPDP